MKTINTKKVLVDMKGEPMKDKDGNKVLLGEIVANVLSGKVTNPALGWQLGKKFATESKFDMKAEEIVFVTKEIETAVKSGILGAVLGGQIMEILDAKEEKEEKEKKPKKKK